MDNKQTVFDEVKKLVSNTKGGEVTVVNSLVINSWLDEPLTVKACDSLVNELNKEYSVEGYVTQLVPSPQGKSLFINVIDTVED